MSRKNKPLVIKPIVILKEFCKPVKITLNNFETCKIVVEKIVSSDSDLDVPPVKRVFQTLETPKNRFSIGELRNLSKFEKTKVPAVKMVFQMSENPRLRFSESDPRILSMFENRKRNFWSTLDIPKIRFSMGELTNFSKLESVKRNFWSTFDITSLIFESKIARLNNNKSGMAKTKIIPRHEFSRVILMLASLSVQTPKETKGKISTIQLVDWGSSDQNRRASQIYVPWLKLFTEVVN